MKGPEAKGVPLLDLQRQYQTLRDEIESALTQVLESQRFVLGAEVADFETEIGDYCGAEHAVGCASGSDAVLLALMALDIGPGDQVLCPSYTFFATAGAIWRLGAEPVFADLDPETYNLCPASVEAAADRCHSLRAILPVHLFGRCADVAAIGEIAARAGVPLVHDAAQAIGARDAGGRRLGESGELSCFSFFPSKNLGGFGDGGLVTTSSAALAARLRALRSHGADKKYFHEQVGLNSRLDALQAAVLRVKLPHLDAWATARGRSADQYDTLFRKAGAEDAGLALRTPARPPAPAHHVFNQYVIRVPAELRDPLRAHLSAHEIGNAVYYPLPLHLQPCFQRLGYTAGSLPESECAAAESLALPIFPELRADETRFVAERVIEHLRG